MNRVEDLTLEQLRDEVWFWREDAAAQAFDLARRLASWDAGDKSGLRRRIVKPLEAVTETLANAMAGDYHARCLACGEPLRPGEAAISDVEEGDMHAACPTLCELQVKPGDKVFMDPEGIVWEGEGPKPDHIVAHAVERLYTDDQVAEAVARSRAALAGRKAAKP